MFSDDEIKEMRDCTFSRSGDEVISIREICLNDKFDKKDFGFNNDSLLPNSGRNDLDVSRSLFRDSFFPDSLEQPQERFAWTEEDENIASLVSEPGFGTTGQTTFGDDLDAAIKSEMKEADTSSSVFHSTSRKGLVFSKKPYSESEAVTSTSTSSGTNHKGSKVTCKVDKTDPRSKLHFVKYVKRHERTVKLWECGICSREFQHQYTLMRHLPTHTDERNFHCDTCGKSFRQLSTLSQHRAIHSTERPYACEVCNKTFNRVSTLISHRKTHSDVKPYRCHVCPKGFHQKGNLRNHLFTHTNERPYRCPICFKGFNQQSNLVCHKNKAHPDDNCDLTTPGSSNLLTLPDHESQTDSTRSSSDQCEVTSSGSPYLASVETSSLPLLDQKWTPKPKFESSDIWLNNAWGSLGSGVIVDPIKTYHMKLALATRQTPFALLKPDNETPVLVKVVDTILPGGKQMSVLVPATAEDLKVGGRIVVNNEDPLPDWTTKPDEDVSAAVQIRVPVVATVVPKFQPGGRLHLSVEEPHHSFHTALSSDIGEVNVESCSKRYELRTLPSMMMPRLESRPVPDPATMFDDRALRPGLGRYWDYGEDVGNKLGYGYEIWRDYSARISSTCALPPPAPSPPPVDVSSMDLFEPMECVPMGPQITAVDNINQAPPSDDSDIFIEEFEVFKHTQKIESISLSDSD